MLRRRDRLDRTSKRRVAPRLEGLERRALLAVTVDAFPLGSAALAPFQFAKGPDGNPWFTERSPSGAIGIVGAIGTVDRGTGVVREFPLPVLGGVAGQPVAIAAGPDGKLWFTDPDRHSLGTIDPATGAIAEYPVGLPNAAPYQLVTGPDGRIWFTDSGRGKVGVIDPTTKVVQEYALPTPGATPLGIVSAPEGGIWLISGTALVRVDPRSLAMTTTPVPVGTDPNSKPTGSLVVGSDGDLWFALSNGLARVDPTTGTGVNYTFHSIFGDVGPYSILVGPDGAIWTGIGEFREDTGTFFSHGVPFTDPSIGYSLGVVAGDGNLWVAGAAKMVDRVRLVPATEAVIEGNVQDDTNANGPGDLGYPDQLVYADLNGNGRQDVGEPTATTDMAGRYSIRGVPSGVTVSIRVADYPGTLLNFVAGGVVPGVFAEPGQLLVAPLLSATTVSSLLPLSISRAPFGASNPDIPTAEVVGLYRSILGRDPDATGGANAVAAIESGDFRPADIAAILLGSDEYAGRLATLQYGSFLGRAPSAADVAAVTAACHSGLTPEGLATILLGSAEFGNAHPDAAGFARATYAAVFGREPTADDVAAVTSALTVGGLSRPAFVAFLVRSDEAVDLAVRRTYLAVLGRSADSRAEVTAADLLRSGTPASVLAVSLVNSPEYAILAGRSVPA